MKKVFLIPVLSFSILLLMSFVPKNMYPCHPSGDIISCRHWHSAGDIVPCAHVCYNMYGAAFPCHPNGDIAPCTHGHPAGDIVPCGHVCY